jgi:nucleoside-triphosphatase THEP1
VGRLVLLTGARGVGKTHLCERVVSAARQRGYLCAGLLSPALYKDGEKIGLTLRDVATGAERPLALIDDGPAEVRTGKYRFVSSTLEWAAGVLRSVGRCHLLVIDELGPLELEMGQGLTEAVNLLSGEGCSMRLVVVRPELLRVAVDLLPGQQTVILEVTLHNRDELPERILSLVESQIVESERSRQGPGPIAPQGRADGRVSGPADCGRDRLEVG